MKTVALELDDADAALFAAASGEDKNDLQAAVSFLLRDERERRKIVLQAATDALRRETSGSGLDARALDALLRDEA